MLPPSINTAEARAPSVKKDKIMHTQHFLEWKIRKPERLIMFCLPQNIINRSGLRISYSKKCCVFIILSFCTEGALASAVFISSFPLHLAKPHVSCSSPWVMRSSAVTERPRDASRH